MAQIPTGVATKSTGSFYPADDFNDVNDAINNNAADAQSKLVNQIAISTLDDLSSFLVSGTYELPEGSYYFNNPIDFVTADIKLITTNGCYEFNGTCIAQWTYTGVTPFITTVAGLQVLEFGSMRFSTPNALCFDLVLGGDSFIMSFGVFISCQKVMEITGWSFLTTNAFAFVGCGDYVVVTNVDTIRLDKPQMSLGLDLGKSAFTVSGTGGRLIASSIDARPEATESIFDIKAGYTGDVSITTGVLTTGGGDFFRSGSRDQTDPAILLAGIKNTAPSRVFASGHVTGNSTETVIAVIGTPVKIAAIWTDVDKERFTFNANGTWTFTGLGPVNISAGILATLDPVGGGTDVVSLYLAVNDVVVSTTKSEAAASAGVQLSATGLVTLSNGDTVSAFVANESDTSNMVATTATFSVG